MRILTVHSNLVGIRRLSQIGGPYGLLLVLLASCTPGPGPATATPPTTTLTTPSVETTGLPLGATTTTATAAACPSDPSFADRGRVLSLDQPASDTNSLGLISWQVDDGCERFEIDFETTEGAPATTPPTVIVDFLETRQVLRVWMEVGATVITDQVVETSLVDRLFVVRDLDEGMFVDLHLAGPAQARVAISSSPARMTLELQAATEPFVSAPAVISKDVVVVSPNIGIETGPAVRLSGYARTFEGNVLVSTMASGVVVDETNLTAADWAETWGEFEGPLTLPIGQVDLFVGEESPDDGQLTGITLSLTVR